MPYQIIRERAEAKRLALFSHKGGVGKTTLTVNLAFALASLNRKVLLVDTDPQCNLSAYLLDSDTLDHLLDASDTPYGETLWSMLHDIDGRDASHTPIIPSMKLPRSLNLVPGDIKLSELEEQLTFAWRAAKLRDLKAFGEVSSISLIVNSLCSAEDIDFVFYDCGPNIGPLNRCVLLDCDYFLVPTACDEFSIRALSTLGVALSGWLDEWDAISELAPDGTYLPPGCPNFLGYIVQQFKVYGGTMTKGYREFEVRIDRHVQEDLISVLQETHPGLVATDAMVRSRFGAVQDLSSLVGGGQNRALPVWEVQGGSAELKEIAKSSFLAMAKQLSSLHPKKEPARG